MIKIEITKDTCCLTHHPLVEAQRAKRLCDIWNREKAKNAIVQTVSMQALLVYAIYGKDTLGLDIRLIVDGEERDIHDFESEYTIASNYIVGLND